MKKIAILLILSIIPIGTYAQSREQVYNVTPLFNGIKPLHKVKVLIQDNKPIKVTEVPPLFQILPKGEKMAEFVKLKEECFIVSISTFISEIKRLNPPSRELDFYIEQANRRKNSNYYWIFEFGNDYYVF